MWKYSGQQRPDFASTPGPDQESVWDYPRPPLIVNCHMLIEVKSGEQTIARSHNAKRILETASPPAVYIPPDDIDFAQLVATNDSSYCEWKGTASYWNLLGDDRLPVGWSYPHPTAAFAEIRDWLSFYPARVECLIDGERARPQEGGFYGGWVTANIVGPWKGSPGSGNW